MSKQTVGVSGLSSRNQIPVYARGYPREYQLLKGINKELGYLKNKTDLIKDGLLKSKRAERIKKLIKIYKKGVDKGKFRNVIEFALKKEDFPDLHCYALHFVFFKEFYNSCCCCEDNNEKTGIEEFYNCNYEFFINLLVSSFEHNYESDSDSDSDCKIIFDSDSDSD